MTAALEGGEWSAARPGRTLPLGKTRYPFYRRLSGPQGRSGRAENLVSTGIRSRTVQPVVYLAKICQQSQVANRLTNWSRVLPEKLTGSQLVKKFSTFYGTQMFVTTSQASPPCPYLSHTIHSITPNLNSWRPIIKSSFHLRLGLLSDLFLLSTLTKILHELKTGLLYWCLC